MFTAQDPTTLRQAFSNLRPNAEYRHLYAAAVARQQADQIFNLSLTRAATKALVPAGARGVIGIGRVKTPTLAIVCRRELEIRDFKPEDYFEVVATATVPGGSFQLRHAPPPAEADQVASAGRGHCRRRRGLPRAAVGQGGGAAPGAATAVRPAGAAEDLRPALGLDGGEDPGRRPGTL